MTRTDDFYVLTSALRDCIPDDGEFYETVKKWWRLCWADCISLDDFNEIMGVWVKAEKVKK